MVKTRRARKSACRESPTSASTCTISRPSAAWDRTVVRFEIVSAMTPVARECASEKSFSAAMTRAIRRWRTPTNTATRAAITSATGQATMPSTTIAPRVVTEIRRIPHTMASMSSTKAHVEVSSVAMTSPEGRSVCQAWLSPIRWSYPLVMARPKERRVAPQLSQPPMRPNAVAAASTKA